jgi:hypothetical protein
VLIVEDANQFAVDEQRQAFPEITGLDHPGIPLLCRT